MISLFDKLKLAASQKGLQPRSKESVKWFRQRISSMRGKELRRIKGGDLMKQDDITIKSGPLPRVGSMAMFFYDPKHKKTLPYYDAFPMIIPVGPAKDGFYGLNVHYLPPLLRAKFLDALLDVTNNKKFDDSTKFQISYGMLKAAEKLKYFKPCFKHYLFKHVRSKFGIVSPEDWEIAIFLPSADWQKGSGSQVYRDSRKIING